MPARTPAVVNAGLETGALRNERRHFAGIKVRRLSAGNAASGRKQIQKILV